jgi:hypothetical protein
VLTSNGAGALPTFQAAGAASLTVGSSAIASGTSLRVLYNNAGTLGEYTASSLAAYAQGDGLTVDLAGFRGIPQNSQSAAYTLVAADAGKHIYHPSSDANARTFTIPANGSVAFPVGTSVTFVNETSQVVTIAITTDTLVLAGTGSTGSRSLAQYGVATAVKVTSTRWYISGSGLT